MVENKQYITQLQDNGKVMISEDVVATIVSQALKEVEGVVGLNAKPGAELADIIGKSWGRGMKITIAQNNALTVDCDILVAYGQSVITVAKAVQETVTNALESTTGVEVHAVNVNVVGIVRQ